LDQVAFPDQKPLQNAAFEMTDGFALAVDNDIAGGDGRAVEAGGEAPGQKAAEADGDRNEGCDQRRTKRLLFLLRVLVLDNVPESVLRVLATLRRYHGGPAAERGNVGHATSPEVVLGLASGRGVIEATTSVRSPNWLMRPSFSTRILSTASMMEGRWAITTTMAPSARAEAIACLSAASPSASRLALGSSSTSRRGRPNSPRARAIRCF